MIDNNSNGENSSRKLLRAGLVTFALQIISVYAGYLLKLPLWLQVSVIVATLALVAAIITLRGRLSLAALTNYLKALVKIQLRAFEWLGYAAPGIAVALLIFYLPRLSFGGPCGFATELRVVTAPENVTALRAAADRYVSDRSGNGCQNATVTVTANSSITGLQLGFANGWLQPGANSGGPGASGSTLQQTLSIGPRPDIWIPDSTVAAQHVQAYVETHSEPPGPLAPKARLDIGRTVGTSPMVVGVFTDNDRSGAYQDKLSGLLARLRAEEGLGALARPSPDTSEAALLTTPILYQALREGDKPWADSNAEVEKLLNTSARIPGDPTALQTSDATTLLCRIREAAAKAPSERPPPDIAVVVPENVLAAYDHNDDLGDTCRGNAHGQTRWPLSVYHTTDLPVLDYPFVQVRWPGEYTARRQAAIDDFREWLGHAALTRFGFRTGAGEIAPPNGSNPLLQELREGGDGGSPPKTVTPHSLRADCAATLQQAFDCYVNARPVTSLSLLVDISGSMIQQAGPNGERSIGRAQWVADGVVAGARPGDHIRVGTFSTQQRPTLGQTETISGSGNEQRDLLHARIQQILLTGSDLRLTEAIRQATGELSAGSQNLVMLTDGQFRRTNKAVANEAPGLVRKLRAEKPDLRIFIVLIGPRGCDQPPVKSLVAALGRGSCVDGSAIPTEDIAGSVMSTILWGDR